MEALNSLGATISSIPISVSEIPLKSLKCFLQSLTLSIKERLCVLFYSDPADVGLPLILLHRF